MNHPLSGYSILVVEDEVMILMMIEDLLAESGCESVTAANSIPQALALIDDQHFDAAMLDLNVRGKSSYSVADALIGRNVPFFFSTGNNVRDMKDGYKNCPALRKPFNSQELASMFKHILE